MSDQKYPTPTIVLKSFQGGRFFRNRWVYSISIDFPLLIENSWWTTDLSRNQFDEVYNLLDSIDNEAKKYSDIKNSRRNSIGNKYRYLFDEKELADKATIALFGYDILQLYYRRMYKKNIWATKLRTGTWAVHKYHLFNPPPRTAMERRWYPRCRIPKEYQWLFMDMINDVSHYNKLQIVDRWEDIELDYSKFDIGEDRKPALYKCNVCGHEDVKSGWHWTHDMYDYISHCPKCKAQHGDPTVMLFGGEKGKFKPTMRMQDDYLFNF